MDGACQSIIPTPAPGELVISEIMVDPVRISDDLGEWFEVYNTTDHELNLAGSSSAVLRLAAHGYAVFGKSPNSELRTPNSELRTPNSELRTPNSELLVSWLARTLAERS